MTILLFGEDTYRSREKLRAIRDRYLKRPGADANFVAFQASEISFGDFEQAAFSSPFLVPSRLVVVEGLLGAKDLAEKVVATLPNLPSSTVAVFWEAGLPDKRLKATKELMAHAKVEEFSLLSDLELRRWIEKRVASQGGTIPPLVVDLLARSTGPDLWRLSGELMKLVNFSPEITAESVGLLVQPDEHEDIFALVDAIGEGKVRPALSLVHGLLASGGSELQLLSMISRQFRLITQVRHLQGQNVSETQIAKRLKLHPFVTRKVAAQARHFELPALREAYRYLREADLKLKKAADGAVVLDLLITELSRLPARSSIS